MYHRRYSVLIALVGALGAALTPALATASTQTQDGVTTHSVAAATTGHEYSSPAANSVLHRTSATSPNPGLFAGMAGGNTSTNAVQFQISLGGLASGTATVTVSWGDGSTNSQTVTAPVENGSALLDYTHTYSALGTYEVQVQASDGQGDAATNSTTIETGSEYVPYGPMRILDTRTVGAKGGIAPQGTYALKVVGAGTAGAAIPAGITAVALNITATEGTGDGFLTVYGDDTNGVPGTLQRPTTSNLNFATNQTISNLVIAPVGPDGIVDIYNAAAQGSVQVVADVAGYFTTSIQNAYLAVSPEQTLDTIGAIGAGQTVNMTVADGAGSADDDGVPTTATAVVIQLTTAYSTSNGFITAFATGRAAPGVSTLNYGPDSTNWNTAIVPIGKDGQISLENNSTGSTEIVGDVTGYFTQVPTTGESSYIPFSQPFRYIDTRPGATDALNGQGPLVGPLASLRPYPFPLTTTATAAVPAVVSNLTVTAPTNNGALKVYPYNDASSPVPNAPDLNFGPGQTISILTFVAPGTVADSNGNYDSAIYVDDEGTAEVIIDEFGEFIS